MKKLICVAITALLMNSCSPSYPFIQVCKLSSDNVQLNENGKFEHKQQDFVISYNFWNYGGDVSFTITNHSNKDIYLLMDNCYFIKNGIAYDYYQNRTYTTHKSESYATSVSASNSIDAYKSYYGQILKTLVGYGVSQSSSGTVSASNQSGFSIQIPEQKTICIPAHSSKHFSEFSISSIPYRQCGFARDTDNENGETLTFANASDSPQNFENRLIFNINGEIVPVINKFHISECTNIYDGEGFAYISEHSKDCNGNNKNWYKDIKFYKHASSNCFYTSYQCTVGVDNDRIKQK